MLCQHKRRRKPSASATDCIVSRNSRDIVKMEEDGTQVQVTITFALTCAVVTWQASRLPIFPLLSPPTPQIPNVFSVQQPEYFFQKVKPHQNLQGPPSPLSVRVAQKAQKELPPAAYLASFFSSQLFPLDHFNPNTVLAVSQNHQSS